MCSFSGTSLSFTHLLFLYLYLHVFLERNNENEASSYASHAPPYSPQTHLDSCLCIPSCSLSSSSTIFSISHFNVCFLSRFYENSYFFSDLFFGFSHLFFSETIMFEELSHTKCRYFSQQEFEPDAILTCSLCHTICCFFLMMELVLNSFKFNTST